MSTQNSHDQNSQFSAEIDVRGLYQDFLENWNRRSATGIAVLFAEAGNVVGFDGSEVRFLTPEVAVLRGVAGMVPPGQTALHPGVNAIQTLVAARRAGPGFPLGGGRGSRSHGHDDTKLPPERRSVRGRATG